MMKRIILFISLVFVGIPVLHAQNTCTDQLKLIQRSFDEGLLDDIPLLLSDCMKKGFTKEEKTNAYKLLIQTYLFSENYQKADEVMIQFLNEFPSYSIAANDPKEFINLHGTYRTKPIFKIELMAGASFCSPVIVQYYGVSDIKTNRPTYKSKIGYSFELNYIDNVFNDFNYSIGASFTLSNFDYTNKPREVTTVTGTFSNAYIGLPVALRYNYTIRGINLFSKIGVEPVYQIKSSIDLTRTDNVIPAVEPITGTESLLSPHRKFDVRPFLAIGTTLNIGRDQVRFSAAYKFSTISQLNQDKLYSNTNLNDKYLFVEDDMLLNQFLITVSYIRSIYKPKKIK